MSEPIESVDVTELDGPFSPEQTAAAARLAADAIRYLNHATAEASGSGDATDVWEVLGSLGVAIGRMRQTLDQLGRSLERDLASGQLRISDGSIRYPPSASHAKMQPNVAQHLDGRADRSPRVSSGATIASPMSELENVPRSRPSRRQGASSTVNGSRMLLAQGTWRSRSFQNRQCLRWPLQLLG